MNKYETVIKVLSQVDHETLERLTEGFFKAYHYSQYLRCSDLGEVLHSFIKYFPHTDVRVVNVTENGSTYSVFGNTIKTLELERKAYSDIEWNNENEEDFNRDTLSIFNQLECCHYCNDCHMCCYISVFFIEDFYTYCLEQNFIKVLIQESKNSDGKIKENKERKEGNMDSLRTIAENLVNNISKYEEIIDNLIDIGVKDEKIYNIFYEILKNINE
jgi:hypothetical protein